MLAVADRENSLIITGNGDVLEPEYGIVAIGSGALLRTRRRARWSRTANSILPKWSASRLQIAGDLCIYTNQNFTIEVLE
jgi:ATP-dependent HslUV protease subunit HslV